MGTASKTAPPEKDLPGRARSDDVRLSPSSTPTLDEIVEVRVSRRSILKGALATGALGGLSGLGATVRQSEAGERSQFNFIEVRRGVDDTHHVAPGYRADVLVRWGDAVMPGAPAFDPQAQTPANQLQQFGYNNDFIGFAPLPRGSGASNHGLLCVNHEYTNESLMFPGKDRADKWPFDDVDNTQVEIEMAAHGGTVIEVARNARGRWQVVTDSHYNRRITPLATEMALSGPAAGHRRLRTNAEPTGRRVTGTLNNCAGGMTPWGTWLMAEENFHFYFDSRTPGSRGAVPDPALFGHAERINYARLGIPGRGMGWSRHKPRFDIDKEPHEANRFGWIVEVDPYDPTSTPIKRTALGRFKHEGAEVVTIKDGRIAVYSGDDQQFEYLYKFVSSGRADNSGSSTGSSVLDEGTLHAARFDADGSLTWLPLTHGSGPLTDANGFAGPADVLIETRRAADLLGATPMDRPEDIAADGARGKVYVMLTNNKKRAADQVDAVNRRAGNLWGQVVEITVSDNDHASLKDRWEIVVEGGDPKTTGSGWHPDTSPDGWFACPDNAALDSVGRLWVATDQGKNWHKASGSADGLWALETEGAQRGRGRMLFRTPVGAELCGPCFTPDDKTLFVAVQHPGADGTKNYSGFARRSTFEDPATRWPDFSPTMPPRPSIVVITRNGGGRIGG